MPERGIAGAALDLLHRRRRVLVVHHDRCAQPRLGLHQAFHLPLVHRARHGVAEVKIQITVARCRRVDQPKGNVVGVKVMRAGEVEVRPRRLPARRPGVAARGGGLRLRVGVQPVLHPRAMRGAVGFDVALPAAFQPRIQVAHRGGAEVHVAVGDGQARLFVGLRPCTDGNVHELTSAGSLTYSAASR